MNNFWLQLILSDKMTIEKYIELSSEFNTALKEFQMDQGIIDTDAPFMERGSYATWPQLRDSTRETLAKYKLSIIQHHANTQQDPMMITILKHDNGYWELYESPMTKESEYLEPKDMGGHITYFKRYTYSSILGLATEEDKINDLDNKNNQKKVNTSPANNSQWPSNIKPKDPNKPLSEGQINLFNKKAQEKPTTAKNILKGFEVDAPSELTMGQFSEILELFKESPER